MVSLFLRNRQLIYSLTKRDIQSKYKSSYLGVFWSFLTPLFMLATYTYFFSSVFQTKWGASSGSRFEFAIFLFCGISIFNFFSDVMNRSPSLIVSNVNYVKKVVFPIEILPVTVLGTALFHLIINELLLISAIWMFYGKISWTVVLLPIILIPLFFISLGLSWFIAALGVYIRDVNQFVGLAVQALIFLSPVFYPITIIPEKLHFIYQLNPLTGIIENARKILIQGQLPDWLQIIVSASIGFIILIVGFIWFKKLKGGFADVL